MSQIIVIGSAAQQAEFRSRFLSLENVVFGESLGQVFQDIVHAKLVLLFDTERLADELETLCQYSSAFILVNSIYTTLGHLANEVAVPYERVAGFNGFPSFFNRNKLELTVLLPEYKPQLEEAIGVLQAPFDVVEDRVGMISTRVVAMIINEAYLALAEGIATKEDIDISMKLGVNYPHGPFEWAQKIGLPAVYHLLEQLWHVTHDERYMVAPLLQQEALLQSRKKWDD